MSDHAEGREHAARIAELRQRLLELHRSLVDAERRNYEKQHGRLAAGSFLELLVQDPAFAWLAPLTGSIVQLDELLEGAGSDALASWQTTVAQLRALLRPDVDGSPFQQRYAALLQESPDVVITHGATLRALRG